jgi:hypothetical protein
MPGFGMLGFTVTRSAVLILLKLAEGSEGIKGSRGRVKNDECRMQNEE